MGNFNFSTRSEKRLVGVHPDLVRVMRRAIEITSMDFLILEGLRTQKRQIWLYDNGATTTLNSRHLTGHAVDIAPWLDTDSDGDCEPSWHWSHYHVLASWIFKAADLEGVPVEWGGRWTSFPDGPHWQLPRSEYPA